jgi:hypothetical protein
VAQVGLRREPSGRGGIGRLDLLDRQTQQLSVVTQVAADEHRGPEGVKPTGFQCLQGGHVQAQTFGRLLQGHAGMLARGRQSRARGACL